MLPDNTSNWTDEDWSDFRKWIKGVLVANKVTVVFTKKDGTERTMLCTTNPELLPQVVTESVEPKRQKKENLDTLSVYDLEKKDWRSFKVRSIKSIAFSLGSDK